MTSEPHEHAWRAPVKPVWWWFIVQGVLSTSFGVFTLITPATGGPGYALDAHGFAVLVLLAGGELGVLGILSRGSGPGWAALLAAGIHAVLASVVLWTLAQLGLAHALLWSITGFLLLQGALVLLGLRGSPVYRLWGLLLGSCMMISAVIVAVAWLVDPGHSFDIPDVAMGLTAILYGIAALVAALQVRLAHFEERTPAA